MGLRVVGQVELLDGQLFVVFKAGHQLEPKLEVSRMQTCQNQLLQTVVAVGKQGQRVQRFSRLQQLGCQKQQLGN